MTSERGQHVITLSPVAIIAVCILLAIGLMGRFQLHSYERDQTARLNFAPPPDVQRQRPKIQRLDELGIQVSLPEGWCVLTTPNDSPFSPTFVHLASGTIIRFREHELTTIPDVAELGGKELGFSGWDIRPAVYDHVAVSWLDQSLSDDLANQIDRLVGKDRGIILVGERLVFVELRQTGKLALELETGLIADFCNAIELIR